MDMNTVWRQARERMKGTCRLCPVCNGKVCAGEVPGMGGVGSGTSFKNNVTAWEKRLLNMRLVHDVKYPSTRCEVLGLSLAMPVIAAPVAGAGINMGGYLSEEAYDLCYVTGCRQAGIIGSIGDSAPDMIYQSGLAAVRANEGWGIPFFKPWEPEEAFFKFHAAKEAGAKVIGVDIDAAGLVTVRKLGRIVMPKNQNEIREFADKAHEEGLAFVLKGLMTVDDAKRAADAGVDGIVVSNHGGRILESTPGTADVLPAIAQAVGHQVTVLVDGGIRNGGDVLKALALGARAVLIGRPFAAAAIGNGADGVALYADTLREQLEQAMILTGCASVADASPALLYQPA